MEILGYEQRQDLEQLATLKELERIYSHQHSKLAGSTEHFIFGSDRYLSFLDYKETIGKKLDELMSERSSLEVKMRKREAATV